MKQLQGNHLCGLVMNSAKGPFQECLELDDLPFENYTEHCFGVVCSQLSNPEFAHEVACASLAALADECQLRGITLDWREVAGCCESQNNFYIKFDLQITSR